MAAEKLSDEQISTAIASVPDWDTLNGEIQRTYQFDDFNASIAFVNKLAEYAEDVQHHPDILIRYNKVTLTVSTHDAGGITQLDFDLASAADGFAAG
ncbi:MAG: 4a-hydroxytetrahydrobiopterin dehydratase [Planctomycetota bacterium]